MAVQKGWQFWGTGAAEQSGAAASCCVGNEGFHIRALLLKSSLAPKLWGALSPLLEMAVQIADEKEEKITSISLVGAESSNLSPTDRPKTPVHPKSTDVLSMHSPAARCKPHGSNKKNWLDHQ